MIFLPIVERELRVAARKRSTDSTGFKFFAWDQEISINSLIRTRSAWGSVYAEADVPETPTFAFARCRANAEFRQFFGESYQSLIDNFFPSIVNFFLFIVNFLQEVISKHIKQDEDTSEMKEAEVIFSDILIVNGDSAEVLRPQRSRR